MNQPHCRINLQLLKTVSDMDIVETRVLKLQRHA